MGRPCVQCKAEDSKYKCPTCVSPYCSVACFRKHKEIPCSRPEEGNASLHTVDTAGALEHLHPALPLLPPKALPITVAINQSLRQEEEGEWRLRRQHLEALANSEQLRHLLRENYSLQLLLEQLDRAADPERDLQTAMESPLFSRFADTVLEVVGSVDGQDCGRG